jgi:hypothetical protein
MSLPIEDSESSSASSLPHYLKEIPLDSIVSRRHYIQPNVTNDLQELPSRFECPQEAQELLENVHGLRTEYEGMKAESLSRLQELVHRVKWIDDKILEVDIHIGKIFHVIEKSVLSVPPPVVVKKEKKVIVEGGA